MRILYTLRYWPRYGLRSAWLVAGVRIIVDRTLAELDKRIAMAQQPGE